MTNMIYLKKTEDEMGKFENFLAETSLYDRIKISMEDMESIVFLLEGKERPIIFCPECGDEFVFEGKKNKVSLPKEQYTPAYSLVGETDAEMIETILRRDQKEKEKYFKDFIKMNRISRLDYSCTKETSHQLSFFILLEENSICKIGQYPSYTDIQKPELKKYRNLLGQFYPELNKAIGLYNSNIGIGSYVYLRRIIEKLVYDAYDNAKADNILDEQTFEYREDSTGKKYRNGTEEKIKLLKGYLPDLITENAAIYGVVSKGIHELTEEECLGFFPVLKDGIVMILEEVLQKKEKEKAEKNYKKALSLITQKIK